jgi:Mg2+/Co2+ transporter CorC
MTKEVMKQALEALELHLKQYPHKQKGYTVDAIEALEEALKQEQDEPVAYGMRDTMIGAGNRMMYVRLDKNQDGCTVPLYERPQSRKPLTAEQIAEIIGNMKSVTPSRIARAIEAAHGIKE